MKRVFLLLLALVLALGVGLSVTTIALAEPTGTWSITGSMNTAREGQTASYYFFLPTLQTYL
jgi:hypothetical protein